jgi:NAD(P)-dependent dehydrogenase (short-subunit alcohol dehydrogenase family)
MSLQGQIAVVTGGAGGIGLAVAKQLKAAGTQVVTWDLLDGADIRCDVSDPQSVEAALDSTVASAGVPSILVCSAGITGHAALVDTSVSDWDRILDINLRGAFLCLQVAARAMIAAGHGGSVVLLSSTAATLADPEMVPYSVSKAGVNQLARVAAVELGKHGIRVNSISPGPTETRLTQRTLSNDAYRDLVVETTPLAKVGTPELLADAILHTLEMEWVTGQNIIADGGTTLVTPRGARRAALGRFSAGQAHLEREVAK